MWGGAKRHETAVLGATDRQTPGQNPRTMDNKPPSTTPSGCCTSFRHPRGQGACQHVCWLAGLVYFRTLTSPRRPVGPVWSNPGAMLPFLLGVTCALLVCISRSASRLLDYVLTVTCALRKMFYLYFVVDREQNTVVAATSRVFVVLVDFVLCVAL